MHRLVYIVGLVFMVKSTLTLPLNDSKDAFIDNEDFNNTTGQNLLVIRSIIYEIGILSNVDNNTDFSNETREEVNVSFFDPAHNGSLIDLSNIPVPVQTNVSGVSITGLVSTNFGAVSLLENGSISLEGNNFPILPNKQVKVSHNISTVNRQKESSILSKLPALLGIEKTLDNNSSPTLSDADKSQKNTALPILISPETSVNGTVTNKNGTSSFDIDDDSGEEA